MTPCLDHVLSLFRDNVYLCLVSTVGGYLLALWLQKKFHSSLFDTVLISLAVTVVVLKVFGIDYETYQLNTKCLTYLVTPATVCLAVPLYRQIELVKQNWQAVLVACVAGVVVNAFLIWLVAKVFDMSFVEYMTFLSKSITMAIGVGITGEYGGYIPITCAVITIAGTTGNLCGVYILRKFRILSPMAQGLAIGISSHAFGTARALEIGETEGAFSGLAIALTGVLTVIAAPLAAALF